MKLEEYRREIDRIDRILLKSISDRFRVIREIGAFKKKNNIPMMQPTRVEEVLRLRGQWGIEYNLDGEFVEKLYHLIISNSCKKESEIIDSDPEGK